MTEMSPIQTPLSVAEPQIVALRDLGIAPENLRASEPADPDIPELADTIKAAGLLYPLLVRPGRKGEQAFMALDGRRRLLALQSLVGAGKDRARLRREGGGRARQGAAGGGHRRVQHAAGRSPKPLDRCGPGANAGAVRVQPETTREPSGAH